MIIFLLFYSTSCKSSNDKLSEDEEVLVQEGRAKMFKLGYFRYFYSYCRTANGYKFVTTTNPQVLGQIESGASKTNILVISSHSGRADSST